MKSLRRKAQLSELWLTMLRLKISNMGSTYDIEHDVLNFKKKFDRADDLQPALSTQQLQT